MRNISMLIILEEILAVPFSTNNVVNKVHYVAQENGDHDVDGILSLII